MFLLNLFGRSFVMTALAGASVVAVGGMAYAASNTVPSTVDGSGSGAVSGYTVSSITYTLGSTPTDVASITFNYSPGTTDPVKARLSPDNGVTWFTCDGSVVGGTDTVGPCTTTGLTVAALATLVIVLTP